MARGLTQESNMNSLFDPFLSKAITFCQEMTYLQIFQHF